MRKQYFARPATESAVVTATKQRVISLEEEMVIIDDAAQTASDVEQDLGEVERSLDTADALEDVAVVADHCEEATPTELALVDSAAQMAVAGSDIEPESVVPAMESYLGKSLKPAVESIRETAASIWQNIQKYLQRIWEKIQAYFRIAVIVPNLEKRVEALEASVKTLGHIKPGSDKISIESNLFVVGDKAVGDAKAFIAGLDANVAAAKFVFETNPAEVAKLGDELAAAIGKFDTKEAGKTVDEVISVCEKHSSVKLPGAVKTSKEGDFEVHTGEALLGGGRLAAKFYSGATKVTSNAGPAGSQLGQLERFRKSGVVYEAPTRAAGAKASIVALTPSEMREVLKTAKDLLKLLKDFHNGTAFKKMVSSKEALAKASTHAEGEMKKVSKEQEAARGLVDDYRALLNFNASFIGWVHSPAMPFYGKALSSVKAVLHLVASSANQYESDAQPAPAAA